MVLEIDLGSRNALTSVLVADVMDLSVRLANLETLLSAFRDTDCFLAGHFEVGSNFISIKSIIEMNLLHRLDSFQLALCLKGWAFSIPHEVAYPSLFRNEAHSSHLCFILETQPTYAHSLAGFFPYSVVLRRLEQMFSMESLGIPD